MKEEKEEEEEEEEEEEVAQYVVGVHTTPLNPCASTSPVHITSPWKYT
jgi:hypothetical protein